MKQTAIRITISGRVQGVGFRAGALHRAKQLGIRGWVKNSDSGGVEIVAEGDRDVINEFLDWCSHGPMLAVVEKVETKVIRINKNYPIFSIRN
jgi:acylphosphatase